MSDNKIEKDLIEKSKKMSFQELGSFVKDNLEKQQQSVSRFDIKTITLENYNQMIEILESKIKDGLRSGIKKNQPVKNKNQYIKSRDKYIEESFAEQKSVLSVKKRVSQSKIKFSSEFVEFLTNLADKPSANFPATQMTEFIAQITELINNEVERKKAEKNLDVAASIIHSLHLRKMKKNLEEILLTNIKKIRNGIEYLKLKTNSENLLSSLEKNVKIRIDIEQLSWAKNNHTGINQFAQNLYDELIRNLMTIALVIKRDVEMFKQQEIENGEGYGKIKNEDLMEKAIEEAKAKFERDKAKFESDENYRFGQPLKERQEYIISLRSKKRKIFDNIWQNLKVQKLPWKLIPRGEWTTEELVKTFRGYSWAKSQFDEERLRKIITKLTPNICYIGEDDFQGYVVFGFDSTEKVVMECPKYGNAIYVIKGNWQEITKLSKWEARQLPQVKVIRHSETWFDRLRKNLETVY